MKIQIKSIAGSVLFEGDFTSIAKAVEAAIKSSADLSYANLSSADLSSADLSSANLSSANLSSADLSYANLSYADLSSANLRYADLSYANLSSANLSSANLSYADLSSANLSSADLRSIKVDFFDVLLRAKNEVQGLRSALVEGRVNGSTYEGECACLVGTIANVCGRKYDGMKNLTPDSHRPIEQLFLGIKTGDKPNTNPISKLAVEWLDEFVELLK